MPTVDHLAVKDIATIAVSSAALVTSVSVAALNVVWQRSKRATDARELFDEAMMGLVNCRSEMERLRLELGANFSRPAARGQRVTINDRRNFYLSRALAALRSAKFVTSSVDNTLLASALIGDGRQSASVPFYLEAVRLAEDDFQRAAALRVYGRARILSGDLEEGRTAMIAAVDIYDRLSDQPGYERDRMLHDAAETLRRLVIAQDEADRTECIAEDAALLRTFVERLRDPIARSSFEDIIAAQEARSLDLGAPD